MEIRFLVFLHVVRPFLLITTDPANPIFQGRHFERNAPRFFEHFGNRGIRHGKWKLVAIKGKPWELCDMQADRTELNNMAAELPEKVQELFTLYAAWADQYFVTKK